MYDVIIIGGGPAGLNAALVLGRSRRKVLICDDENPRNAKAISIAIAIKTEIQEEERGKAQEQVHEQD